MTWNCAGLSVTRGLQLLDLVRKYDVDVLAATETEINIDDVCDIDGYTAYRAPSSYGKTRHVVAVMRIYVTKLFFLSFFKISKTCFVPSGLPVCNQFTDID